MSRPCGPFLLLQENSCKKKKVCHLQREKKKLRISCHHQAAERRAVLFSNKSNSNRPNLPPCLKKKIFVAPEQKNATFIKVPWLLHDRLDGTPKLWWITQSLWFWGAAIMCWYQPHFASCNNDRSSAANISGTLPVLIHAVPPTFLAGDIFQRTSMGDDRDWDWTNTNWYDTNNAADSALQSCIFRWLMADWWWMNGYWLEVYCLIRIAVFSAFAA